MMLLTRKNHEKQHRDYLVIFRTVTGKSLAGKTQLLVLENSVKII